MRRHHLPRLLATVLVLLSAAPLASAAGVAPPGRSDGDATAVELAPFLDQFAELRAVRLRADAVIRLETPRGVRTGRGSFVYEEQGDLFRIRCQSDRGLGLMDDVEYVHDGERSLIWFLPSNTVSANTSGLEEAPTAFPNPFYLPLEFAVDARSCPQCRMSVERLRRARESGGPVLPNRLFDAALARGELPPRDPARIEVRQAAGLAVPGRITRALTDRAGETTVELGDYRSFDGFVFPRAITLQAIDGVAGTTMRIELAIRELEVDRPRSPAAFARIGDERSTYVLSGDPSRDVPVP